MIRGSLKNLPLPDMFQLIANGQKSGMMTLTRHELTARLEFHGGRLAFASITPGITLTELLVEQGELTLVQAQELLSRVTVVGDSRELVATARQLGSLDEAAAARGLEAQALRVLRELLEWSDGGFEFAALPATVQPVPAEESMDALNVLMQVMHHLPAEQGARPGAAGAAAGSGGTPVLVVTGVPAYGSLLARLLVADGLSAARVDATSDLPGLVKQRAPAALILDDEGGEAWEALRAVRRDPELRALPVLVLCTTKPRGGLFKPLPKAASLLKPFTEEALSEAVSALLARTTDS